MPAPRSDDIWTARQVAEYLSVSVRTMRRWRHEKRFPSPIAGRGTPRWRCGDIVEWARRANGTSAKAQRVLAASVRSAPDPDAVRRLLKSSTLSLDSISARLRVSRGYVLDAIDSLRQAGINVVQFGERFSITRDPQQLVYDDALHLLLSDDHGKYRFGVISDTHYGSKYAREDVVQALYEWFQAEGLDRVYHAGNWIDGESRFNKFDLLPEAHGMQAQLDYMVAMYPRVSGVTTYYVAGDDHEGWYCQREGVDIGRMLETTAQSMDRTDLRYMGYMESFITLRHSGSGEESKLLVCHPGGGSAYALSYAPQKVAESWQPGEKPGVAVFGHWHKLEYAIIRGVHSIQAGCTKDQDPFARKKRLQYQIGGWIIELEQDPQGGISGCKPWLRQWFDRDYYNHQWSMSGPVVRKKAPSRQAVTT